MGAPLFQQTSLRDNGVPPYEVRKLQSIYPCTIHPLRDKIFIMEENRLLEDLEEIAEKLSIDVQYDDLMAGDFTVRGGLCKLRGRHVIIMDRRAPPPERIEILVRALRQFDLSSLFIKPYIRSIIGEGPESQDKGNLEKSSKHG
jgi:hypothetical protein